jgi:hypothetical protein
VVVRDKGGTRGKQVLATLPSRVTARETYASAVQFAALPGLTPTACETPHKLAAEGYEIQIGGHGGRTFAKTPAASDGCAGRVTSVPTQARNGTTF